ncbi:uncharacterized protein LOC143297006 isoform X2 [Babylonia areolata]|uniref:uncharacterized protein LOC143297006 isoform X2 n=1 Tax=Babylonia areolata TaxID=304850 RepID=UPI003FD40107
MAKELDIEGKSRVETLSFNDLDLLSGDLLDFFNTDNTDCMSDFFSMQPEENTQPATTARQTKAHSDHDYFAHRSPGQRSDSGVSVNSVELEDSFLPTMTAGEDGVDFSASGQALLSSPHQSDSLSPLSDTNSDSNPLASEDFDISMDFGDVGDVDQEDVFGSSGVTCSKDTDVSIDFDFAKCINSMPAVGQQQVQAIKTSGGQQAIILVDANTRQPIQVHRLAAHSTGGGGDSDSLPFTMKDIISDVPCTTDGGKPRSGEKITASGDNSMASEDSTRPPQVHVNSARDVHFADSLTYIQALDQSQRTSHESHPGPIQLECTLDGQDVNGRPCRYVQTRIGIVAWAGDKGDVIIANNCTMVSYYLNDEAIRILTEKNCSTESVHEVLGKCLASLEWSPETICQHKFTALKLTVPEEKMPRLLQAVLDLLSDSSDRLVRFVKQAFTECHAQLRAVVYGSLIFTFQHTDEARANEMLGSEEMQGKLIGIFYQFLPEWVRVYARWEVMSAECEPASICSAEPVARWLMPRPSRVVNSETVETVDQEAATVESKDEVPTVPGWDDPILTRPHLLTLYYPSDTPVKLSSRLPDLINRRSGQTIVMGRGKYLDVLLNDEHMPRWFVELWCQVEKDGKVRWFIRNLSDKRVVSLKLNGEKSIVRGNEVKELIDGHKLKLATLVFTVRIEEGDLARVNTAFQLQFRASKEDGSSEYTSGSSGYSSGSTGGSKYSSGSSGFPSSSIRRTSTSSELSSIISASELADREYDSC